MKCNDSTQLSTCHYFHHTWWYSYYIQTVIKNRNDNTVQKSQIIYQKLMEAKHYFLQEMAKIQPPCQIWQMLSLMLLAGMAVPWMESVDQKNLIQHGMYTGKVSIDGISYKPNLRSSTIMHNANELHLAILPLK